MSIDSLESILENARTEAEFEAILLTDFDGHILSAARSDDISAEVVGALLDAATRFAANPEDRARLGDSGESTFFDWEGRQMIYRWFMAGTQRCLLVILSPHGRAYKRAVGQLVRQTQRALTP